MPKIVETAIIDDPPKLKSGNGSPVKGIKPTTVAMFIKICRYSKIINPASRNFSNSESVVIIKE